MANRVVLGLHPVTSGGTSFFGAGLYISKEGQDVQKLHVDNSSIGNGSQFLINTSHRVIGSGANGAIAAVLEVTMSVGMSQRSFSWPTRLNFTPVIDYCVVTPASGSTPAIVEGKPQNTGSGMQTRDFTSYDGQTITPNATTFWVEDGDTFAIDRISGVGGRIIQTDPDAGTLSSSVTFRIIAYNFSYDFFQQFWQSGSVSTRYNSGPILGTRDWIEGMDSDYRDDAPNGTTVLSIDDGSNKVTTSVISQSASYSSSTFNFRTTGINSANSTSISFNTTFANTIPADRMVITIAYKQSLTMTERIYVWEVDSSNSVYPNDAASATTLVNFSDDYTTTTTGNWPTGTGAMGSTGGFINDAAFPNNTSARGSSGDHIIARNSGGSSGDWRQISFQISDSGVVGGGNWYDKTFAIELSGTRYNFGFPSGLRIYRSIFFVTWRRD
tara:strand:- start:1731 stop:3053 length:1323 start_codon:yes stop_codon:yes gene_type:complete